MTQMAARARTSAGGGERRRAAAGLLVVSSVFLLAGCGVRDAPTTEDTAASSLSSASPTRPEDTTADGPGALRALEQEHGARLGLYAVDTGTGRTLEHRADERFAFASTAKAFAVAAVLERTTDAELDISVPVHPQDVLTHSPVTETYAGAAIPLREVAEAAMTVSDNTAMNLLLDHLGGPQGLQDALVEVGDTTTDPERYEPELNDVVPGGGDPADTSTPRALATTLRAFAVDDALAPEDREQLVDWLVANTTGDELVRAGVPDGWLGGHKTGSPAGYGARNDIAVVWPGGDRAADPWVLAITTTKAAEEAEADDELLAEATRVVVDELGGP